MMDNAFAVEYTGGAGELRFPHIHNLPKASWGLQLLVSNGAVSTATVLVAVEAEAHASGLCHVPPTGSRAAFTWIDCELVGAPAEEAELVLRFGEHTESAIWLDRLRIVSVQP